MQLLPYFTFVLTLATFVQAFPLQRRTEASVSGIAFNFRNPDGSCQSYDEIKNTIKLMSQNGIRRVRTYAQDCDTLATILTSIKSLGVDMTVLAAVWVQGSSNDESEITKLKHVLETADNTGAINGIVVGNEVLYNGWLSSGALAEKINAVKSIANGIPVGTVDIPELYSQDLIDASDFVAVNIQPFYAPVSAEEAMANVRARYEALQEKAEGKEVLIAEVGWPTSGNDIGPAHPSVEAEAALASAMAESGIPYYFFEWQDSSWKGDSVESHYGILDASGHKKFSF
ncbi:glycoside hydrolase superfamily [Mycotypha africana]|uniref:glycoside hydrolase superfamily n=1 Tax=Mycotypha africana TaxID=64632 RepID=UPI0023015F10|nr:glycoside hydrolase superfamily [Mycotypha africana]KAI8987759.1 glycoside hydrolase superfamily [Mycotypha africana]